MVTRDGSLEFPDDTDTEIVNGLLDALETAGFTFPEDAPSANGDSEYTETDEDAGVTAETDEDSSMTADDTEPEGSCAHEKEQLTISLPLMAPDALERLKRLVEGKATLFRKALDADSLAITLTDKLNFPWWNHMPEPDEVAAYMAFLAALCRMAQNAKRVNVKDKPVESEKYSFRIILIRLGFSGAGTQGDSPPFNETTVRPRRISERRRGTEVPGTSGGNLMTNEELVAAIRGGDETAYEECCWCRTSCHRRIRNADLHDHGHLPDHAGRHTAGSQETESQPINTIRGASAPLFDML